MPLSTPELALLDAYKIYLTMNKGGIENWVTWKELMILIVLQGEWHSTIIFFPRGKKN